MGELHLRRLALIAEAMKVVLLIYGSLDTVSGGYLFDRKLVAQLRARGDTVEIVSLRRRAYALNLLDNLTHRNPSGFDVILQDELTHPSLALSNHRTHRTQIVSIVHHLRSSERRPRWQNAIYRGIEKRYLRSVDGFIFNSEATRASVESLVRTGKPFVVTSPGGDRVGSSTAEHIRRRARRSGPLELIYLGAVIPAKGLDVLLEALSALRRDEFRLAVVGNLRIARGFAERMRRKARELGLPVKFEGELGDREVERRLRESHVLALPSYYEGFGIAYLEGMAHGLPALGIRAGAVPDLVRDGVNGYLVQPGDAMALARRLNDLAADRGLLVGLSLRALETFHAYPTWEQSTGRMREFLFAVTDQQRTA